MSNPINGVSRGNAPLPPSNGKSGATTKSDSSPASGGAAPQDSVSLTNAAESLQALEKSLAASDAVSVEKVEAIKLALTSGQYKIDPDLIAEKFLEVERALGKV